MDAETMLAFRQGIAAAVSTAVQQVLQGMPANPASVPVVPPVRKRMDERHRRRMKHYDGKDADWKDQLRVAVRANSNDVAKVMDWVEVQTESEIDMTRHRDFVHDEGHPLEIQHLEEVDLDVDDRVVPLADDGYRRTLRSSKWARARHSILRLPSRRGSYRRRCFMQRA